MNRSEMLKRASTLSVGDPERKRILSHLKGGTTFDRPKRLPMSSILSSLKKAESMYEFDGSNDQEVLHHIGQALTDIAWIVRELGDPQAEKLMDVTRVFENRHR